MKKQIDSKKYSDLSSDINKIKDVKGKLDQWIQNLPDPAQPDPESEEKSQKRDIIEAWFKDLNIFSGTLEEKIEEKTLGEYLHDYSKLEASIENTLRQIDILKMVKDETEIERLEDIVKRDKSSQKTIGEKVKKIKPHVVFYKELIQHFDVLVTDYGENEKELKKIRGKIDRNKKLASKAAENLYGEYEKFLRNMI